MKFTSAPKQGYFLELAKKAERKGREHAFGGTQDLPGAVCLACDRRLFRMASLDTRDSRLGLKLPRGRQDRRFNELYYQDGKVKSGESPILWTKLHDLPLLYCWSCGSDLNYRLNPEGGVDVLGHSGMDDPESAGSCLPYEPYPESVASKPLRLKAVPAETQDLIRRENAGRLHEDGPNVRAALALRPQVGGEPRFLQKQCLKGGWTCELCRRKTPFLASITDFDGDKSLHGGAYVQVIFHYCEPCQVINAYHECD